MPRRPDLPCSDCGRLMWRGRTSLPAGRARCRHPCRRARAAQAPGCPSCGKPLTRARGVRRCSDCATVPLPRPSAGERGYGTEHQRLRVELLPKFIGTECAECGQVMTADQALDLDHSTPLRVDPNSKADRVLHRSCNAAWNRKGEPTGFNYSPKPCEVCGANFKPKLPSQTSCSRACGVIIRRRRRLAA